MKNRAFLSIFVFHKGTSVSQTVLWRAKLLTSHHHLEVAVQHKQQRQTPDPVNYVKKIAIF